MPVNTKDSSEIVVAGNGTVWAAPFGTAMPTNETVALNAAFTDLGYMSEDGIDITPGQTIQDIMAWQAYYAVRKIVTQRSLEVGFTMEQFNGENIILAMGGGTWATTTAGHYKYSPPSAGTLDFRSLVIDVNDGAAVHYRLAIPKTMVTDIGAFKWSRGAESQLPIKMQLIQGTTTADAWNLYTDQADALEYQS